MTGAADKYWVPVPERDGEIIDMGIMDMLTSVLASKGAANIEAALIPVVLGEIMGKNGQGGLSAIIDRLRQAGFGKQVDSWIAQGRNLPISAKQIQDALGSDLVRQLAARFGIPVDQLSTVLAEILPKIVDQASPSGTLPHAA